MTKLVKVAVVGASGFIGSSVAQNLVSQGFEVVPVRAPRLPPMSPDEARNAGDDEMVVELSNQFSDCKAVINAAGEPDASLRDEGMLNSANGGVPGVLARAVRLAHGSSRFIHVSSAVVQGRAPVLDSSPVTGGFSAYARSKVLGELLALEFGPPATVVYRPPSVHAEDRRVSRQVARIASSPLAVVAAPGSQPTPQALVGNVSSAIAFLAVGDQSPPRIVSHPSEGLSTSLLMELLGGHRPRRVPRALAEFGVSGLERLGRHLPGMVANARRAEMILLGQAQADSWLTEAGWQRPYGHEGWLDLGLALKQHRNQSNRGAEA